jgi:hypothetical protein
MKEGDVVIVAMAQSDGSAKNRPTIILREMPPIWRFAGMRGEHKAAPQGCRF